MRSVSKLQIFYTFPWICCPLLLVCSTKYFEVLFAVLVIERTRIPKQQVRILELWSAYNLIIFRRIIMQYQRIECDILFVSGFISYSYSSLVECSAFLSLHCLDTTCILLRETKPLLNHSVRPFFDQIWSQISEDSTWGR